MQYRVLVGGRLVRLDLAWPSHRVGLEFDGEDFHTGDGTLRRDRARHNALTRAGWTMLYATATDIYRDPGLLIAQLADLLLLPRNDHGDIHAKRRPKGVPSVNIAMIISGPTPPGTHRARAPDQPPAAQNQPERAERTSAGEREELRRRPGRRP